MRLLLLKVYKNCDIDELTILNDNKNKKGMVSLPWREIFSALSKPLPLRVADSVTIPAGHCDQSEQLQ